MTASKIIKAVKARIEKENTLVLTIKEIPFNRSVIFVENGKTLTTEGIENIKKNADIFEADCSTEKNGEFAVVFRKVNKSELRRTFEMLDDFTNGIRKGLMTCQDVNDYDHLLFISSVLKCKLESIRKWVFGSLSTVVNA